MALSTARSANLLAALALGLTDCVREAEETAARYGSAAPSALVSLHEFLDGATIDELRRAIGLTPSGAVRMVDKLSGADLVQRRPGSDARSVSVVLTRRGHHVARQVLAARQRASAAVLAGLSERQLAALTPLLETLLKQLTAARLAARRAGQDPAGGWLCRLCDFSACGRPEGTCPVAGTAMQPEPRDG